MDPHFNDISLGLYEQTAGNGTFSVHTFSSRRGANDRTRFVVSAMAILGGMTIDPARDSSLHFPCKASHYFLCRRIFIEAAKVATGTVLEAKPMEIWDKKTEQAIRLVSLPAGRYLVDTDGNNPAHDRRAAVAALGLAKLGDMEPISGTSNQIRFSCGTSHDAGVGLLLTRALNVRSAMREVEARASRGVLAAPSSQMD